MTIAQIEQKLSEHRDMLGKSESQIAELRGQRAKLSLQDAKKNKQKIEDIDKHISQLVADSQNLPSEIEVLESDLVIAQEKQTQNAHNKLLSAQEKFAEQVELLSVRLVDELDIAVATNDKLTFAYNEYCKLQKLTGENCISKNICRGSLGSLKYLSELCSKELSGKLVMRQPMTAVPI